MRVQNTTTILLLSTIFVISTFVGLMVYAQPKGEAVGERSEHTHDMESGEHGMEMMPEGQASDKARCAIDGMEMKKSAMVEMEHHGRMLYFCSKKQMEMFKKNPKKYLRVVSIGDVDVNINILTMKEYKDMMNAMGMGGMMKMEGMDKATHYINAYLTDKKTGASIPAYSIDKNTGKKTENFKIQVVIISPDSKVQKPFMKFIDMMKYHAAGFNLTKGSNYKIKVILEAADIEYKI
jgi:YHS domain-containing protein